MPALQVSVLCLDAEDYSRLPVSQFEEDNLLRELNKCLIGFGPSPREPQENSTSRRLSPIGESSSSPTPPERKVIFLISFSTPNFIGLNELGVATGEAAGVLFAAQPAGLWPPRPLHRAGLFRGMSSGLPAPADERLASRPTGRRKSLLQLQLDRLRGQLVRGLQECKRELQLRSDRQRDR